MPAAATQGVAAPRGRPAVPTFGMILFLASELMFFGGLFTAYFTLRTVAPEWPPPDVVLEMPLTVLATVLLTVSSLTMHRALVGLRAGHHEGMRLWVLITMVLGMAFLAIKLYEFATASFGIGSHAYGSMWFTMLGAHAVHLLVGLVLLGAVLAWYGPRARRRDHGAAEAIGYYWHFVDGVWLLLFSVIYLMR